MKLRRCKLCTQIVAVIVGFILSPVMVNAEVSLPGADVFKNKGCVACHSIKGQGGEIGPALDNVGSRYNAEWIYQWLRDPSAVKPGTLMPKLDLSDQERALLVFYLLAQRSDSSQTPEVAIVAQGVVSNPPDIDQESIENDYLNIGTEESYIDEQRYTLQDQIQTFIPPLLEPAFTQPSFVLPPGAARVSITLRDVAEINEDDFANEEKFGARFVDFDVERRFYDLDVFLGLDDNYTLRVNVPFLDSSIDAAINPAFLTPITVFPQGSTIELGDISVFLKKKFVDQGNFPVGFAWVAAVSFPTGSNEERFDDKTVATLPGGTVLLPLPALDANGNAIPGTVDGTFRRFSNDGRLPSTLQSGLDTFGGSFGLFATRILEGQSFFGRGALHAGALYQIRPESDGIDPGDKLTAFATVVKPIIGDNLSLDLTYVAIYQGEDSYEGLFAVPDGLGGFNAVQRPPFSGGTTQFFAPSLIWSPNPLFRVTLSGLFRISEPNLGPSPEHVIRLGFTHTFATGLFQ